MWEEDETGGVARLEKFDSYGAYDGCACADCDEWRKHVAREREAGVVAGACLCGSCEA